MKNAMDQCAAEACFIMEHYFCTNSFETTLIRFCEKFGDAHALHNTTIKRVVDHFHIHHTVEWREGSERLKSAHTETKQRNEGENNR